MTTVTPTPRAPTQQRRSRRRRLAVWVAAASTAAFTVLAGFFGWQLEAGGDPALGAGVSAPSAPSAPTASDGVSEPPAPLVTRTS